jgi:hypothetical protein
MYQIFVILTGNVLIKLLYKAIINSNYNLHLFLSIEFSSLVNNLASIWKIIQISYLFLSQKEPLKELGFAKKLIHLFVG